MWPGVEVRSQGSGRTRWGELRGAPSFSPCRPTRKQSPEKLRFRGAGAAVGEGVFLGESEGGRGRAVAAATLAWGDHVEKNGCRSRGTQDTQGDGPFWGSAAEAHPALSGQWLEAEPSRP